MSSSDQQHDFATTRWSVIAGGIVWLYFASSKISHQEAILLHASQKHSEQEARVAAAAEREAREKLVGARDWAMSDEGPIDERTTMFPQGKASELPTEFARFRKEQADVKQNDLPSDASIDIVPAAAQE
jgi:hypothetical protein